MYRLYSTRTGKYHKVWFRTYDAAWNTAVRMGLVVNGFNEAALIEYVTE